MAKPLRLTRYLLVMLVMAGAFFVIGTRLAAALGLNYWDDSGNTCDVAAGDNPANSICDGSAPINLITSETYYVQKSDNHITAYFTSPNNNSVTFQNLNFCNNYQGDLINGGRATSSPAQIGAPVTDVITQTPSGVATIYGTWYGSSSPNCNNFQVVTLNNLPQLQGVQTKSGQNLYYATFDIKPDSVWKGGCSTANGINSCDGIQNAFSMVEGGPNGYEITQNGNQTGYGVTVQEYGSSPLYLTYKVRFGPTCDVTSPTAASMYYYDMDNAGGSGAQIGRNVTMTLYDDTTNTLLDSWTPATNNNANGSHAYANFIPGHDYVWRIENVYYNNTIQFSSPWPGIMYGSKCLPPDSAPTGTISVFCSNENAGTQTANVTFNDQDAKGNGSQLKAYLTVNGTTQANFSGGSGSTSFAGNRTSADNLALFVYDVMPDGSVGGAQQVATAQTNQNGPCQPPQKVSCSITITPADVGLGVPFTATVIVPATPVNPSPDINIALMGNKGVVSTQSKPASYSGGAYTASFNFAPITSPGAYSLQAILQTSDSTVLEQPCNDNFAVANQPYLTIYGSDGTAGAYPANASPACQNNSQAGFWSWNFDGNGGSYLGAGAEYAVMALGQITHFASSLGSSTGGNPQTPVAESFANQGNGIVDMPNATYGGSFGTMPASCDFIGTATADSSGDATVPGQTITSSGAVTYNGSSKPNAKGVIYIYGHDVYISGSGQKSIVYSNGVRTKLSDIPSFKLIVVGGDIYIDSKITELDGLYVAEPNNGKGGTIYTCSTGLRAAVDPTSSSYFNTCNNQLKIYGAFAAKQVRFLRSYGSLNNAKSDNAASRSSNAAEEFIYTPELWLAEGQSAGVSQPLSITGLPPVL